MGNMGKNVSFKDKFSRSHKKLKVTNKYIIEEIPKTVEIETQTNLTYEMFIALEGKFPSIFIYSFEKKNSDGLSSS